MFTKVLGQILDNFVVFSVRQKRNNQQFVDKLC